MKPVLASKEVKECERYTIEQVGIPSLVLMEKAALFVCSRIKDDAPGEILILCGYGNNGADGLAAARILAGRGRRVRTVMVGREDGATEENRLQQHILERLRISVERGLDNDDRTGNDDRIGNDDGTGNDDKIGIDDRTGNDDRIGINDKIGISGRTNRYAYVIDALFGIGLHRNLEGDFLKAVSLINGLRRTQGAKVISVDLPSGLHADSGSIMGDAVIADETVTFQWMKPGMLIGKGPVCCGRTIVGEIGICKAKINPVCYLMEDGDIRSLPYRDPYGNKGTYGKILSVTGSAAMAGAMVLSTQAAFRSGAGMVSALSHPNNRSILAAAVPEALFHGYEFVMDPAREADYVIDPDKMQELFQWSTSLLIGCGLSKEGPAAVLTEYAMRHYEKTLVADADALNLISCHLDWLTARKHLGYLTVLTPHPLEFARLCGEPVEAGKHRDMEFCRNWAKTYGCILVVKDAVTLITDGETAYLSDSGTDALATAGSGDVLAGMVAVFSGMGGGSFGGADAAAMAVRTAVAVFIHGKTGCQAAERYHRASVKAADLPEMIPIVLKEGGI